MFISFNSTGSTILNVQRTSINASTTATDAVVLQEGQYLHIQNESSSIAYISLGKASDNPASANTAFWRIPPNTDAYFESIPVGQINVALNSGSGKVNFITGIKV